jgi:hypothetical protein
MQATRRLLAAGAILCGIPLALLFATASATEDNPQRRYPRQGSRGDQRSWAILRSQFGQDRPNFRVVTV